MGQNNVEKWDWKYTLFRKYVNFSFRCYLKSITIHGKENIPDDSPVIFAPNHQNALMDALALGYSIKDQPVFLARSDIFKKKIIARILTFLKILPIYRIRDGFENLKLNEHIMKKVREILLKHHCLVMFPEGNHGDKRQLRPLKKGITRIAFQSEEKCQYKLGIKIIPVGLDYSDYYRFNEELFVNFGKPIDLTEFFDLYKENPSKANLALRNKLSEELKRYMVHIDVKEYYDTINQLRNLYPHKMQEYLNLPDLKQPNKFKADKKLIEICESIYSSSPEKLEKLSLVVKEYSENLRAEKLNHKEIINGIPPVYKILLETLFVILLFPVYIYGWINNLLSYFPAHSLSKKMKDPQFISSIKYGVGIITFPLFYLLQTILVYHLTNNILLSLIYLISIPLTGLLAFKYLKFFKRLKEKLRMRNFIRKKPKAYHKILILHRQINNTIEKWAASFT
ncbi:MAG: lysophospholipid acyltransferase family protein [Bacteroidales bacterium]